jgi:hypothetical protein
LLAAGGDISHPLRNPRFHSHGADHYNVVRNAG